MKLDMGQQLKYILADLLIEWLHLHAGLQQTDPRTAVWLCLHCTSFASTTASNQPVWFLRTKRLFAAYICPYYSFDSTL